MACLLMISNYSSSSNWETLCLTDVIVMKTAVPLASAPDDVVVVVGGGGGNKVDTLG